MSPRGQGDHARPGMPTPSTLPSSPYDVCFVQRHLKLLPSLLYFTQTGRAQLPQPFSQVMRSGPLCVYRAGRPLRDLHTSHGLKSPEQDATAPGQGSDNPKTTHFAARGTVSFCSLPASSTEAGKTQPCPHSGAKHMGQQTQSKQHSSSKAPPFFLILLHSSLFFNVLLPCLLSFQDCSEATSMQEHLQASSAHAHTHALVHCHCPRALAARGASPGPAH